MNNDQVTNHSGAAQFFDTDTGLTQRTFDGIKGYVKGIAVSPDGRLLALLTSLSLQGDGVVQILDAASGREIRRLTGDSGIVTALAFTPDGKRLAVAAGSRIKLWDVAEGLEVITLPGGASTLAFSPDGQFLVTVMGGEVRVFEATPPARRIPLPAAAASPPTPPLSNEVPPDPLPAAARTALRSSEKALTENDPAGALLWSVRAFRSDPEHADRLRVHIGLLRQSLPPLGGTQPVVPLTPEQRPDKLGSGEIKSTLSPQGRLIAFHGREGGSWVHVFDATRVKKRARAFA